MLAISGRDLKGLDNEAGGHRIQRVPPTERRGRVHTSTVTVAVLDPTTVIESIYAPRADQDFQIVWFSGTGAGGQHRNKHQNSCRVIHTPSGLSESRQGRERASNLKAAKEALLQVLDRAARDGRDAVTAGERRQQVGTGQRGDKSVTIRFQDDRVQHHTTGRTMSASRYMRGYMDEVWGG